VRIRNAQQKTRTMKTFKINFLDIEDNTIYSKVDTYFDEQDATNYGKTILATTSDECVTFEIYEL
jgi:hypothetical protein